MKRTFIFMITLLFSLLIQGQSSILRKANSYYNRAYYSDASSLYSEVLKTEKSIEIYRKAANSFYFRREFNKALPLYKKLFQYEENELEQKDYFYYGHCLKANGDINGGNQILQEYYLKTNQTKLAGTLNQKINELNNIIAIGNRYVIKNLEINTPFSEFGAIPYKDKLVFLTPKNRKKGFLNKVYKWNDETYLDLFEINKTDLNKKESIPKSFSNDINTSNHEGNITFTKDFSTAYFTRNSSSKEKGTKITHLHIYKAEYINGKWKNITPLPFNKSNFSTMHPALSPDEKTLYFSSDMPGSIGGFDIYKVSINGENNYGKPVNLGNEINTKDLEQFPFISYDNKLYFSSNGHLGYGALDIFVSSKDNNKYTDPKNVGAPINSKSDDFSFYIDENQTGYFASNRAGGKGKDDIYSLKETKKLIIEDCIQFVKGKVTDKNTNTIIANTKIILITQDEELLSLNTDVEGNYQITLGCEKIYALKALKADFESNEIEIITTDIRKKTWNGDIKLTSLAFIAEKKEIELKQNKERELKRIEKQKKKERLLAIKKAKIEEEKLEKERIEKKRKEEAAIAAKKSRINTIIKTEQKIKVVNNIKVIDIEKLYFDYNLSYVRLESRNKLKPLIKLLNKYPDMHIEIRTHTDIRGNKSYNKRLSSDRAKSIKKYIKSQGIDITRISSIGVGESEPLIKCPTVDDCTEEQHELNRRCEFVITKFE